VIFYSRAFDWEIGPTIPGAGVEYAMVTPRAEGTINGGIGNTPPDYAGHVTFYVGVPSLENALAKIESLGGKTIVPPEQVPNGPRIALFDDPEGHAVGLVETAPEAPS
jgi:predicted enzyme related to lactoylglutathione lyase